MAHKSGLKFVFGTEAYWVRNRFEKDRSNHHIVILARNENGRQAINDILSEANISGYYFRPRVDLDLLFSLPADDVFITTACIAFRGKEDVDDVIVSLHNYFGNNFMLEIQNHNTQEQIEWNKHLLDLSLEHNIELIVGLDSHYIYPNESEQRDYVLSAKNVHYDDEEGWYLDYPDDDTVMNRFLVQGVFDQEQIQKAMNNTDICLEFDDYDDIPVFTEQIKLPSLYPELSQKEKNDKYCRLIKEKFEEYMKDIPESEYKRYYDGVKSEIRAYVDTGMVDYPLLDYEIVKDAVAHNGLITYTGRGSAVGFFTNTLCGFSKVDRFTSAIKLYPERFISKSRILETNSLPDIDMNLGNVEIFEESQKRVLGEDHAYPMIAFGTFKKKSAFKLYAKAKGMDFELANEISEQITKYDKALQHADDDEKDDIKIEDYVDKKYHSYLKESEPYWGIISDKKKAPSAYLLYQGSIRKEIGLIKCKSESTKKEVITTVMDGAVAEKYKFLKNDLLKVDVVLLTAKVFERIGIEQFNVNTLLKLIKEDEKVWNLYANGHTLCLNQVEKKSTTNKVMNYKPKNISEMSAFVASVRPGFKSMYKKFESREPFSYGIAAFDKLLQTEELPVSFMLFQEQVMNTLNYAGFPIDQCYGIIKAIAKKHPEKVKPLKSKFLKGFSKQIIIDDKISQEEAKIAADKVWKIINDNCSYSFNSAHAYCMALDSLYQAWQKANYPYEFYEVMLQHYSDKGNKDKVADIKQEMTNAFGIEEGEYRFGLDNRKFVADKDNNVIYPSLLSIKGLSQKCANDLYKISNSKHYESFYELLKDLKQIKSLNNAKIETLVEIGYFKEFGNIGKIEKFVKYFDDLYKRSQFQIEDLNADYLKYIEKYSTKSNKQYRNFDFDAALTDIWNELPNDDISIGEKIRYEYEKLGYIKTNFAKDKKIDKRYVVVTNLDTTYSPKFDAYCIATRQSCEIKIHKNAGYYRPDIKVGFNKCPVKNGDVIYMKTCKQEPRKKRAVDASGKELLNAKGKPIWENSDVFDWWVLDYYRADI